MLQAMSNDARAAKTWAIGVHLAEHHLGPLRFVAALLGVAPNDAAVGIHVMPDRKLLQLVDTPAEIDDIHARIRADVAQLLADESLEHAPIELAEDDQVARGL